MITLWISSVAWKLRQLLGIKPIERPGWVRHSKITGFRVQVLLFQLASTLTLSPIPLLIHWKRSSMGWHPNNNISQRWKLDPTNRIFSLYFGDCSTNLSHTPTQQHLAYLPYRPKENSGHDSKRTIDCLWKSLSCTYLTSIELFTLYRD